MVLSVQKVYWNRMLKRTVSIFVMLICASLNSGAFQESCSGGEWNYYRRTYYMVWSWDLCGPNNVCEYDSCGGPGCPGWLLYCIGAEYYGQYPGCLSGEDCPYRIV